jgi:hypothetical protein
MTIALHVLSGRTVAAPVHGERTGATVPLGEANSPIQWRNTAPTVGMKLFNIVHFHRSRLRRLIEPTGALGSIMISGAQIRAARGLLCWTRQELARRAVVSDATVYGLQTARGSAANPSTLAAVQATLEAGHRFLDGPAPGLRLHP